ncbi:unnamed protein product [Paramecium primaurelia]|uniref:Uncharacterized protein n=1 Tax=Paramecium primaurelia TaxID=5886 RepID=A0A8S1N9J8_PARPR|nr:unnamed protein product [Paramecium primaurelia]
MIIEECRNIMNTYKMNRDIHRNTNQPILEEFNKEKEQEKENRIVQDKRQEFNREYIKKLA